MKRRALFVGMASLIGCESLGPVDAPEFEAQIRQLVPPDEMPLLFLSAAHWNYAGVGGDRGAMCLGQRHIYAFKWSRESRTWNVIDRVALANIDEFRFSRWARSRVFELRLARNGEYRMNSFVILDGDRHINNVEKSEQLNTILSARIRANGGRVIEL